MKPLKGVRAMQVQIQILKNRKNRSGTLALPPTAKLRMDGSQIIMVAQKIP